MAFFALELFTFIMFFQPAVVFPWLVPYRPYRYSAILALILYLFFGEKSKQAILSNRTTLYFLGFVGLQILSASAIWIHGGIDIFNRWKNLIIIFILIFKSCTDERKIKRILLMIVLGIIYLSYYSITNVIKNYEPGILAKGFGWYVNGNDLVLILVSVIPLSLCLGELSSLILIRYLFLGTAAIFAFNILLAGAREGLLGLMVVGSLGILFAQKLSRLIKIFIACAMIASILTFGIATVMTRPDLGGQLTGDTSSETRIIQWKACVRMVRAHPLLGVGPDESASEMRNYGGVRGLVPHNTLIQAFAETGIPGGIFFVMCTIYPLWEAWKFFKIKANRSKLKEPPIILYKYLVIALGGFWACAFFSNRIYFKILYVFIALITALRENIIKKEQDIETR